MMQMHKRNVYDAIAQLLQAVTLRVLDSQPSNHAGGGAIAEKLDALEALVRDQHRAAMANVDAEAASIRDALDELASAAPGDQADKLRALAGRLGAIAHPLP